MKFIKTHIQDVVIIEPKVYADDRGFFMETWQQKSFLENVTEATFVQDNHSKSSIHTLRGLHYQIKHPQGKLVRVSQGAVFDVAVDLRRESPSFKQWVGVELSAENKKMLWVPPGFAHGFYVTSNTAEFVYKCSDYYYPEFERSLLWCDPKIGIDWPIAHDTQPLLSKKDSEGLTLDISETY